MIAIVAATEGELRGATQIVATSDACTLVCGVGPVEAAIHTAEFLATYPEIRVLLHVGLAGARRNSGVSIGDVVIGAESRYCDTASTLVNRIAAPSIEMVQIVRGVLPEATLMPIGTSADVGGTNEVDVEAMEGFAVLRAAHLAGAYAVEVRVISNEIEEYDRSKWQFARGLATLEVIVPKLVTALHSEFNVMGE